MTSESSQPEVFTMRPPTPAEVDQLATISAVSFVLGFLAFMLIVGAALVVAIKTQLPGRWAVFLSFILLFVWWASVQFMGGDLEVTFGPLALLVTYTMYSAIALVFAFGYLRMSLAVLKQRVTKVASNEA
ncbi:hypothetical protein [Rhodoferax sp. TH121]|uniref:hypothetical protein n=1 Tax=Rhodoferax sp. TH121 TaxID=2022803 RepID=UPI001140271B|nr:hypothetical protein [Rhodoferax sp. TH121]